MLSELAYFARNICYLLARKRFGGAGRDDAIVKIAVPAWMTRRRGVRGFSARGRTEIYTQEEPIGAAAGDRRWNC